MAQRSFKTDESFLEKLAIGAIGTQKVIEDLKHQGHAPVELERGSTGYKIWKTVKIKRVRVPDILCVNSGIRVESRAKTNLVISMSHSSADETRGWDFGLKDEDFAALVVCEKSGEGPVDWLADNKMFNISKYLIFVRRWKITRLFKKNLKGLRKVSNPV